jgi:phosphoribosylanthranilate isomerase
MIRIKICGITNLDDARAAAAAGADAIGLNFFSQSRRFVEPASARQIVVGLPANVTKVGVFVNHSASQIARFTEDVGLDAAQLHGDEIPQLVRDLPAHIKVIRAHRCGAEGLAPLERFIAECRLLARLPDAVLIDADAGANFGGTGRVADWTAICNQRNALAGMPMILAGGLTPDNVGEAIAAVHPEGVDVASGVESSPGKKDIAKVRDFIAAARDAFSRV